MTSIRDAARITRKGRVQSTKALIAAVVDLPFLCAAPGCSQVVRKDGNFCSMTCALTPKPTTVEETTMPPIEHNSPCGDKTCTDAECQARVIIRQHLLTNMSEQDRIKTSAPIIQALQSLLADPVYMTADPESLAAQAIETGVQNVREGFVQQPKAVIEPTPKTAVRKPTTAKHQPRLTDNKEHPVTEKITMTKREMEQAIMAAAKRMADALIAEREAVIVATPATAPADKPVEVVKAKGGRMKIERATAATREFAGTTLPAIVVNEALTIPALEVGEESIDMVTTPKVRSPYNKARYKVDKTPTPLDKDTTTYRTLIAEHLRISALVGASVEPTKTKAAPKVAAAVVTDDKAKRKAQVQALMTTLGITKVEAKALLSK